MAIMRREEVTPATRWATEWDPFKAMRELMGWEPFQEMVPRFGRGERSLFAPAFDVRETSEEYVFTADLPGFKDRDIDINVTGNRLTVSGKREQEQIQESDTFYCSERSFGTFSRSFTLPRDVNADQIQADLKEGILSLHVPKAEGIQPKRITVRSEPEKGQGEGQQSRQQQQQPSSQPPS